MADGATLTIKLTDKQADQLRRLAEFEGSTVEAIASDAVNDVIEHAFAEDRWVFPGPPMSPEEMRASIEEQLRRIDAGEEELIPHDEVMKEMRELLKTARKRRKK